MPTNNKLHSSNTPPSTAGGGGGDASSANQVTGNNSLASIDNKATTTNSSLSSIDSKLPTTGQKTMINSQPVVIASDQTAIPITRNLSAPTTGSITTATSTVVVTNLNDTGAVTVSVYGTYTGVNFTFEAFDGVNWVLVPAQRVDTASIETTTGVIASTVRAWNVSPLLGFVQFRVRATAYTSGTANIIIQPSSQFIPTQIALATGVNNIGSISNITNFIPGVGSTNLAKAEDAAHTSGDTLVGIAGVRQDLLLTPTSATNDYGYLAINRHGALLTAGFRTTGKAYKATANITPVATPTDICGIFGNATNTVQVTRMRFSGIQTTTGTVELVVAKRTTANTGSTPVNFSVARVDTADGANVTTPVAYTATNPTTGTLEGNIFRRYVVVAAATSGLSQEYVFDFPEDFGKAALLSGTTQGLCFNLNGVTLTGGAVNIEIDWIEY